MFSIGFGENNITSNSLNEIKQIISLDDIIANNFTNLLDRNSDTVGWLKINNTNIDYPVLQHSDNNYYLNHSFNKEYNSAGWIFLDYRNKLDNDDKNIIIYGHNRLDGSMFSSLKNVFNKDWYLNKENLKINLYTIYGNKNYQIFSIYKIKNENYYTQINFNSKDEYKNFLNTLKQRSFYDFNENLNDDDFILTLSTCADNNKYRIVIHAKQIN